MTRSLSCTITEKDAGKRCDSFLADTSCYPSRNAAVKAIEMKRVFINGQIATKNLKLKVGDTLVYEELPVIEHEPIQGENIPLDVRYEDEYLLVLSKQTGLCVHPSPGHYGSTLCHALVYQYGSEGLAHIQGDDRPGIVHRLDMETSGLLMCAKTDESGLILQDMIRLRDVDRRYLALVHGNIAHDTGMIDRPIARGFNDRLRMIVTDRGNAREAITTFKVLERFEAHGKDNGYTLLECKLYTGRTHQIRVHMEYIGHCCVGDPLYSWGVPEVQLGLQARQFLHSYALGFEHPFTGQYLNVLDALPPDLQIAYDKLADRSMGKTEEGKLVFARLQSARRQTREIQLSP